MVVRRLAAALLLATPCLLGCFALDLIDEGKEEMERYYEEHRTHFMLPIEYRLSQILLRPDADETPQAAGRGSIHRNQ